MNSFAHTSKVLASFATDMKNRGWDVDEGTTGRTSCFCNVAEDEHGGL